MPRKPDIDSSSYLNLKLRETIRSRLDLWLWSEMEGRVPKGKYKEFFEERTLAFFNNVRIDLAPFGLPEGTYVEAPKEMVPAILAHLKEAQTKDFPDVRVTDG